MDINRAMAAHFKLSPGKQMLALLLSIVAGSSIFSLPGVLIIFFMGEGFNPESNPDLMRLMQFFSAIGTFLVPALTTAWLSRQGIKEYLCIRRFPTPQIILGICLSMLLLTPLINLTMILNESMQLPNWAAPLENWMKAQEETMQHFTELLLHGGGICPLFSNLIVIALTAAVTEEFLFRGALQRILSQWTRNHHIYIWATAFLFSAIHLQFYGFVPRLLMGAYLGYLLVWSRNIWVPVCAHFFNNAVSVLVMSQKTLQSWDLEMENATLSDPALWLLAIFGTIAFYYSVRLIRRLL